MFKQSFVIPARNEGDNIRGVLCRISDLNLERTEVLVVVDSEEDQTVAEVVKFRSGMSVQILINRSNLGAAGAITLGIKSARGDSIIITMADGSDDLSCVPEMLLKLQMGSSLVCASRYSQGGASLNAPLLKSLLSKVAGLSLFYFGRIGTKDATNAFKAFRRAFVEKITIESQFGFTIGIELLAKARQLGLQIEEVPTIWTERAKGKSKFKVIKWMPAYLRWYFKVLMPKKQRN